MMQIYALCGRFFAKTLQGFENTSQCLASNRHDCQRLVFLFFVEKYLRKRTASSKRIEPAR